MLNFRKARKKSIVEAVQITDEVLKEMNGKEIVGGHDTEAIFSPKGFIVITKEGIVEGKVDDYLMKGGEGELYVCDKEIFEKSYEFINGEG